MSRYRRSLTGGATYFFTVNTYQRQTILTHPDVRSALRDAIQYVRETMPFFVDAWVLLPDHLHTIWTLPEGDAAYGKRWGMIKAHVSGKCAHVVEAKTPRNESRIKRREGILWQRRFWEHQIRDDLDYQRHVDYIHFNPVKHGLVTRVADWPHSTFHRYVKHGVYREDWALDRTIMGTIAMGE
ncbi:MAG: transposase [Burkholderiales bacterium]